MGATMHFHVGLASLFCISDDHRRCILVVNRWSAVVRPFVRGNEKYIKICSFIFSFCSAPSFFYAQTTQNANQTPRLRFGFFSVTRDALRQTMQEFFRSADNMHSLVIHIIWHRHLLPISKENQITFRMNCEHLIGLGIFASMPSE